MKRNIKTVYSCQLCGYQSPKWMGKCPECGKWHTLEEETCAIQTGFDAVRRISNKNQKPVSIDSIIIDDDHRFSTNIKELDRVLGGGVVPGTLVLIGGDPGIGKSTLMLQALYGIAKDGRKVLYVSGEESIRQIGLRSVRLSAIASNLLVVSEIDVGSILAMIDSEKPDVLVVDSIQTMFSPEVSSAPGSVGQVRESAVQLMLTAKRTNIPIFLIGHVTKDGLIAGPRLLEHMVDTVLYFEGDKNHVFRILRAVKNRFGSTNEIGVFEMNEQGLVEVSNPSALFLSERLANSPGSVVTASMEGTRPVLVELQALIGSTGFGSPRRRTMLGIDHNRVALLVAVIEKKIGMHLMDHDIFMNVAGGVKIDEPAVDLAIVSAVISSFKDQAILDGVAVAGEVGLTGEVRAIGNVEARIFEAEKMGFKRFILPQTVLKRVSDNTKMEIIGIKSISDAVEILF